MDSGRHVWMSMVVPNTRGMVRKLRNKSSLLSSAILTIVFSIATHTPVIGLIHAAIRPLPIPQTRWLAPVVPADFCRIAKCKTVSYSSDGSRQLMRNHSLLRGSQELAFTLTGRGEPDSIVGATVPAPLFSHLGVKPVLGRLFLPDDNRADAAPVALLSERLWKRRFNADPKLVGTSIILNGQPCSVIGILPASFRFPFESDPVELWVPLFPSSTPRIWLTQRKLARLKIDG
jgi:putative ABC transport system permease protein